MKVKIILIILLLNIFYSLIIYGQRLIPGIKAGVNFSNLKSPQFNSASRKGLDAGLVFLLRFGEKFELSTEYTYSQKGANAKGRIYDDATLKFSDYQNFKLYINSFNFSIIGNYYIKYPYLGVQAGPVFGIINRYPAIQTIDRPYLFGSSNNMDSLIFSDKFFDSVHDNFDYSLTVGIYGGSENFKVNLRYYIGLRNYYKKDDLKNAGLSIRNNLFQISISYIFSNLKVVI
jgi:hypothetical protein